MGSKKKKKKKYTDHLDQWHSPVYKDSRTTHAFKKRLLNGDLVEMGVMAITVTRIEGDRVDFEISVNDAVTGEPMTQLDTITMYEHGNLFLGDMFSLFKIEIEDPKI